MTGFARVVLSVLAAGAAALGLAAAGGPGETEHYWPQWRGPLASGAAPDARPPVEWSETKNVRWKVEVPGRGLSTPIVWGDLVFVTTAVPTDKPLKPRANTTSAPRPRRRFPAVQEPDRAQDFLVLAYRRDNGELRWSATVREEFPHEGTHQDGSFAAASPVTDGERLYVSFGSRGLYCLDMNGERVWEKDLGLMSTKLAFGEGASPALHGDRLVLTWDHEGQSFVIALDRKTGDELWRTVRDENTTWATPLIVSDDRTTHVVTSGTKRVRSYDLESGRVLWEAPGLTRNVIPSPVFGDGIVYLTSGFRGNALYAVRLAAARGELSGEPAIAWRHDEDTPYVPSPLLYANGLYFLKSNSAILTRLDAASGKRDFMERLEGLQNVYASPVAADGRVYVVGRDGTTAVLGAGPTLEVLAVNLLDDEIDASPALVGADIYLRGHRYLYRIGTRGHAAGS